MMRLLRCIFVVVALTAALAGYADSIPSGFSRPLLWSVGAEAHAGAVLHSNTYLAGANHLGKSVDAAFGGSARVDFSFGTDTRQGMLYRGVYQGIGFGGNTFSKSGLLGSPLTAYIYQGAPIRHLSDRLWLGYEWKFGVAFGWKHYDEYDADDNLSVSTSATAMMSLGLKLHYAISDRWRLSAAVEASHFSNGNTAWPNGGVNTIGATIGIAYLLQSPQTEVDAPEWLEAEADKGRWMCDIMAYGAMRKRVVSVGDPAEMEMCPGKFGVAGLQISPMRKLNRWVTIGPSLDLQWDESACLAPYWVEGSTGDNIRFYRPPFCKQISAGLSAHAELTMPIFAVNAGVGFDVVNPKGNKRFYQSLALKTFVTKRLFLNIGYRLANFNDPENLMLGFGFRI